MQLAQHQRMRRWLRFAVGGGVNTAATYGIYLALNTILGYQFAYLLAYALGVILAYWVNAVFVFRVPLSWAGLLSYPLVYVVQYLVSALLLEGLVEYFGVREALAPLLVVAMMVPVTYAMSKLVLGWISRLQR